jgi:hypothetical protein
VHKADNLATSRVHFLEIWEPQTPGTLWAYSMPAQGLLHHCFTIHVHTHTQTPIYTYVRTSTLEYTYKVNGKCTEKLQGLNQKQQQKKKCYTMFVRTRVFLSYGFGIRISCRLKKISTCAMAHVHRLFRYRLSLIRTLQHCSDQALNFWHQNLAFKF